MSQQQDLETVVNALLKGIKSQPTKTQVKHVAWVEKHFGLPKSGEEILWRVCWLMVIPAILITAWMPIAHWCFINGLPMVPILVTVIALLIYGLVGRLIILTSEQHTSLIQLQLQIPLAVMFFVFVWELLRHG